jgi:hypothetical protein
MEKTNFALSCGITPRSFTWQIIFSAHLICTSHIQSKTPQPYGPVTPEDSQNENITSKISYTKNIKG